MIITQGDDRQVTSPVFVSPGGDRPTDADALPTLVVTRADASAAPAPVVSDPEPGDGRYQATLTAAVHAATLDRLTLTWSAEVAGLIQRHPQDVEVAGGRYVGLAELRGIHGLGDESRWPAEVLDATLEEFERLAEDYCAVAFVPRAEREIHVPASQELYLEHPRVREVQSVALDGQALTGYSVSGRRIRLTYQPVGASLVVTYTHGYDQAPPQLARAARDWAEQRLLGEPSGFSRLATSIDNAYGNIRLATPGDGRPTGIPSVDATLNRLRHLVPVVA